MKVKLISVTPEAEKTIMYAARVSNPKNQNSDNTKLIDYCVKKGHWSIFEMANMCVEIETSRAISAQILRHKSFFFQEYSQRYSDIKELDLQFENYGARSQDLKNRQNSYDDLDATTKMWFKEAQKEVQDLSKKLYREAIQKGIAKECARFLLPLNTATKLYMNGTIRSWIHYIELRSANGTQLEHKEIAEEIKKIFCKEFPNIAKAKQWI